MLREFLRGSFLDPNPEQYVQEPPEVTQLREAFAGGDIGRITSALESVKQKCTPGLDKLFESDPSLFQTLGSRFARTSNPETVSALLKILADAEPKLFSTISSDGSSLTSRTAFFAAAYKIPQDKKTMLVDAFRERDMDLATPMDAAVAKESRARLR